MIVENITTMRGFLLMGFSDNHELQIVQAVLFLVTYLVGSAGNVIIITITTLDPQLQSPMYYFLKHFPFWTSHPSLSQFPSMLTVPWHKVATFHMHSACCRFFSSQLLPGVSWPFSQ
uniref:Uncharacterized protein n=1 Tax=Mus musculus TaxID=10090 RepID=Q8C1J3_MOUSE|nr:unnamed protein product [Mus musculus]